MVGTHGVDERERLARALREAEARLQALLDGVPVGLYRTTPQGEVLEANETLTRMLGFKSKQDLLGTNVLTLVLPEDRRRQQEMLEEQDIVRTELRLRRRDGSLIWVEDNARAVRNDRGETVAYEGSIVDITERRRSEERRELLAGAGEVLVSSLEYEATLSSVARLVVRWMADYCVIDLADDLGAVTRLAVTHRDPAMEELTRGLLRYPTDPRRAAHTPTALRTGEAQLVRHVTPEDLAAAARDDEHRRILEALSPTSMMAVPLIARGRTLGVILFASTHPDRIYDAADLQAATELARRCALAVDNARLYAEAQEAIRARDEFLTIAAHELRTPVTGVKSGTQLLLRRLARQPLDVARLHRTAELIDDATDHLVSLAQDLIDVAKIRRGQLPLQRQTLDLTQLVGEVAARFREHLDDRHHLAVDLPDTPVPIGADRERVDQVITNLLQNAAKYSPDGGDIRVTCQREGTGALLRVTDDGIGLPHGSAEAIFELFGRAPNAMRMHLPGLGLGLHICRDIVQRHGGRIWAESAGEEQGTTVSVWLPAEPPTD